MKDGLSEGAELTKRALIVLVEEPELAGFRVFFQHLREAALFLRC
ncbi:hypothetical protein [Verrucomicrobium spinosum]|nr:hypothetical protein [Verrucomicrobium spinosum]